MKVRRNIIIIMFLIVSTFAFYLYREKILTILYGDMTPNCNTYNITKIYKSVDTINKNRLTYSTTTFEISGRSSQGGEQINYYDNENIMLNTVLLFNETGKLEMDFYRKNDIVFFIESTSTSYVGSIYNEGDLLIKDAVIETYILDKSGNMCKWELNTIDQKITNEEQDTIKSFILKL